MTQSLSDQDFAQVVRFSALVAIDVVITDPGNRILVGLRTNEPAKGQYFVPGGVVRKDETLDAAFARIVKAETGLDASRKDARYLGVYEHFYRTNRYHDPVYGTHYVVQAYELRLSHRPSVQLDAQHSQIQWLTTKEILASSDVHENTKAYFGT